MLEISSGGSLVFAQIAEGGMPASFAFSDDLQLRSAKASYSLPIQFDVTKLKAEDRLAAENGALLRTSMIIPVVLNMVDAGEWSVLQNGIKILRLSIKMPEAIAIMLYYDRFFIPDGGKLFIYNANRTQLLGAYSSNTNPDNKKFATEFVAGDELILEYNEPQMSGNNVEPDIRISGIGYGYNYLKVSQSNENIPLIDAKPGGNSIFNCQVNVNCPEGNNWQNQKKGVAKTIAPVGNAGYLCSGSLVNNTAQDLTPYYLSANHCFADPEISFDQILFYFHYESTGCSSTTPTNTKTIVGAQLLVDLPLSGSSDGTLLLLNSNIPNDYGVYYNGWDRRNIPAASGTGIHHPNGEIKKISTFYSEVSNIRWTGNDDTGANNAHWRVFFDKTQSGYSQPEGGSSGSPLFNQDGLVVGTLTGGSAANCTTGSYNWYGKMWYHWDNANAIGSKTMRDYLDPLNTKTEVLNGIYNVVTDNVNLINLTVSPGTLVPAFNTYVTNYTVNVSNDTEYISISTTPTENNVTITGTGTHPLYVGSNLFRVVVNSPDNSTSTTYTITVNRELVVNADRYEPNNIFVLAYTLPLSFADDLATVETTGSNFHNKTDIDYYKINLPTGYNYSISARLQDLHYCDDEDNIYTVDAIFTCSTNGNDWSETYDDIIPGNIIVMNGGIVYFRVLPYFEGDEGNYLLIVNVERKQMGANNDDGLSALTLSPGDLSPAFSTHTTNYTVDVRNRVSRVMVSATPTNRNAIAAGIGYHQIQVGSNSIPVVVTAQNGLSQKTYSITVVRSAEAGNDANLQNLTVDQGALSPVFSANNTSYSVDVANNISRINIGATASDEYAAITGTGEFQLRYGSNEFDIVVTAENGSTFKTYKIIVNRDGGSSNANLQNIIVDRGELMPAFNSNVTNYVVFTEFNTERIFIFGEAADDQSIITGNGNYTLTLGVNTVNLVVTSPDNSTRKIYTIVIFRGVPNNTENNVQHALRAYPNPAHDQIIISGLQGSGVLSIFNTLGRECLRHNITSTEENISVSALSPGIYFIRISETGNLRILKIIIE